MPAASTVTAANSVIGRNGAPASDLLPGRPASEDAAASGPSSTARQLRRSVSGSQVTSDGKGARGDNGRCPTSCGGRDRTLSRASAAATARDVQPWRSAASPSITGAWLVTDRASRSAAAPRPDRARGEGDDPSP